jgi:hypothetical protein
MSALVTRRTLLTGGVVAAAMAVVTGVGVRLPVAAAGRLALSAEELRVVRALAEVMFPSGHFPRSGVEVGVEEEVDRIVGDVIAPVQAAAFRYVLRALEWGTMASRGLRFSALPLAERREVLAVWAEPGPLPRRIASDAVKAVMGMAYFSDRSVLDHIGYRATCGWRSA